ncbi:MAG: hypothetical protein FVQ83_13705 [Chloroflexi bacterium]|nr:hypothetical protein [Chloroflexota bacterium]
MLSRNSLRCAWTPGSFHRDNPDKRSRMIFSAFAVIRGTKAATAGEIKEVLAEIMLLFSVDQ